jgi:hypothetical protein
MNYAEIERTINEFGEKVNKKFVLLLLHKYVLFLKAKKGSLSIEDMDGGTFTIR